MKLLDVNLLIYAVNESSPPHTKAKAWLEKILSGTETVALPWIVLLAFLRLTTRAAVFPQPLTPEQSCEIVARWLAQPCVAIIHASEEHFRIFRDLLLSAGTAGNLTTDAHLAALAIEHGTELCSCDADFARFRGLKWTNPLA